MDELRKAEELHDGQEKLHEDQEKLQEAQHELLVEQKVLNDRMIAHLAEFDHEKELVNEELVQLAQWKAQEEKKLKRVVKGLMIFVTLWALGGMISGYFIWDTVQTNQASIARINMLGDQNAKLIKQVDALNRTQADQVYDDCVQRNQRTQTSQQDLSRLVRIAKRDGNPAEAAFWASYLDNLKKVKLPTCVKPKAAPTGDGDPTETPTSTTTP